MEKSDFLLLEPMRMLYRTVICWTPRLRVWTFMNRLLFAHLGRDARLSWTASFAYARRIHAGDRFTVREYSRIAAEGQTVTFGDDCTIGRNVLISAHGGPIQMGNRCSVNPNCCLYGLGGLTIGNGVRIAAGTMIVPNNHNFENPDIPIVDQGQSKKGIVIEDDVWIGANAVITDGVHIGRGCVIGAGSVVTHDLPPLSVAVGSPARVLRQRGERMANV